MGANDSTLLDLRDLGAEGRVRVILTRNIGRRSIDPKNEITFLRLRGTETFASAIRGLSWEGSSGNISFVEDKPSPHIDIGYDLGMLNEVMLTQEFMPLYGLKESSNNLPEFSSFQELLKHALGILGLQLGPGSDGTFLIEKMVAVLKNAWMDWESDGSEMQPVHYPKRIMLSRYGLFQVILDRKLKKDGNLLRDIIQPVQRLGKRVYDALDDQTLIPADTETSPNNNADKDTEALKAIRAKLFEKARTITEPSHAYALRRLLYYSVQWELAREILYQFLKGVKSKEDIGKEGTAKESNDVDAITKILADLPTEEERAPITSSVYNSRFRYVVYEIEEFKDIVGDAPVSADLIRQGIASLLENAPVEQVYDKVERKPDEPDSSRTFLQNMKPERQRELFQQDVATWEGEHCLFTHDNALIYHSRTIKKMRGADYKAYWGSVLRAIRYYTEVRLGVKLLDIYSSIVLEKLTQLPLNPPLDPKKLEKWVDDLDKFETRAINSARILARLRYQAAPTTVGSSDYAIMKYERLREVLAVGECLESADASINTILNLLSRYKRF